MSSMTIVLIPLGAKKSVDCVTERVSFGIQAGKQWSWLKRLRKQLFPASERVLVCLSVELNFLQSLLVHLSFSECLT